MDATRFLRVWKVAATISAQPGITRADLAHVFTLSERQIQADLNIIREDLNLPLVRQGGYRLQADVSSDAALPLADVHTLLALCPDVWRWAEIARKLAHLTEPHVRPIAEQLVDDGFQARPTHEGRVFRALVGALLAKTAVRLALEIPQPSWRYQDPVLVPTALVRYRGSWYVVGPCPTHRRATVAMIPTLAIGQVARVALEEKPRVVARELAS